MCDGEDEDSECNFEGEEWGNSEHFGEDYFWHVSED